LKYSSTALSVGSGDDDNHYTIGARDILQANATIIAGILILLTLVASNRIPTPNEIILILATVIPFVISCMFILIGILRADRDRKKDFKIASFATIIGLVYLAFVIIYLLIAPNLREILPPDWIT